MRKLLALQLDASLVTLPATQPAAKEESMTKPKLVFNPVSQEYFDNPYEIYQRMRDEAPALLRRARGLLRADPARGRGRGVQGPRLVLVGPRLRPGHGALRGGAAEVDHLHGPARPSPHAQPAQQGVHAARHPVAEGDRRRARSSTTSARRIRTTSTSCRTSPARSRSRSSPGWPACPRTSASRSGTGSTRACIASRDRSIWTTTTCRPTSTRACTTTASSRSAGRTRRTT